MPPAYAPAPARFVARPYRPWTPPASIGWTSPTTIYDTMRQIERKAADLGPKILSYVADDPAFVRAWQAWDQNWSDFNARYQSDTGKLGALFHTDDLARQVEAFRKEILDFEEKYRTHRQASGMPVPAPSGPPALPGELPPERPGGFSIPWWVWMAGGAAVLGLGYWAYRTYVAAPARLVSAAVGRDMPFRVSEDHHAMIPPPRTTIVEYRPYMHPHLLPQGGQGTPSF